MHIGICHLKPCRPAFLRVTVAEDLAWEMQRIEPVVRADGQPDTLTDIEFMHLLALSEPSTLELHKLITFSKLRNYLPSDTWHPSARLVIDPLHKHLDGVDEGLPWWSGANAELAHSREKPAKKAADEARRKARQATGEVQSERPRREPMPAAKRDAQVPPKEEVRVEAEVAEGGGGP